jgi:signal peptidase I
MRDGVLFINGEAVPKQRVADYVDKYGEGSGRPIPQYVETLPNGVTYKVLDMEPNGSADNTEEYVVPPGNYFMMGDNRDNSRDSRYAQIGYVPRENIIAKATSIASSWNLSRIGMKIE